MKKFMEPVVEVVKIKVSDVITAGDNETISGDEIEW